MMSLGGYYLKRNHDELNQLNMLSALSLLPMSFIVLMHLSRHFCVSYTRLTAITESS